MGSSNAEARSRMPHQICSTAIRMRELEDEAVLEQTLMWSLRARMRSACAKKGPDLRLALDGSMTGAKDDMPTPQELSSTWSERKSAFAIPTPPKLQPNRSSASCGVVIPRSSLRRRGGVAAQTTMTTGEDNGMPTSSSCGLGAAKKTLRRAKSSWQSLLPGTCAVPPPHPLDLPLDDPKGRQRSILTGGSVLISEELQMYVHKISSKLGREELLAMEAKNEVKFSSYLKDCMEPDEGALVQHRAADPRRGRHPGRPP